jgi:hypothetical protein
MTDQDLETAYTLPQRIRHMLRGLRLNPRLIAEGLLGE